MTPSNPSSVPASPLGGLRLIVPPDIGPSAPRLLRVRTKGFRPRRRGFGTLGPRRRVRATLKFESLEHRRLLSLSSAGGPSTVNAPAVSSSVDLRPLRLVAPDRADWGEEVTVSGAVVNQGGEPVSDEFLGEIRLVYSVEPTRPANRAARFEGRPNAPALRSRPFPASRAPSATVAATPTRTVTLGTVAFARPPASNQVVAFEQTLRLPSRPPEDFDSSRPIRLALVVDPNDRVAESDETNQSVRSAPLKVGPVNRGAPASLEFFADKTQASWGDEIAVSAKVANLGSERTPAGRARVVLTPVSVAPGGGWDVTLADVNIPALEPNMVVTVESRFSLPKPIPLAFAGHSLFQITLLLDADYQVSAWRPASAVADTGRNAATLRIEAPADAVPTLPVRPNLAVTQLNTPAGRLVWGDPLPIGVVVTNMGTTPTPATTARYELTDEAATNQGTLVLGQTEIPRLEPGQTARVTHQAMLPYRIPTTGLTPSQPAAARLLAIVDPEGRLDETSETDNALLSEPFTIQPVFRPVTPPRPAPRR